jgi:hypothetical protein
LIESLLTIITLQFLIQHTTEPLVRAVGNPYRSDLDVKGLVEVIPQRLVSFLGSSAAFGIPNPLVAQYHGVWILLTFGMPLACVAIRVTEPGEASRLSRGLYSLIAS